ncbi:HNH nuclease family protein YajD [Gammaproteobacteria bacterium]
MKKNKSSKLDQVVADAHKARQVRDQDYREQALKLYPWICGRCSRDFTRENLRELTVHHRNHNHDDNPGDGSNWELLCLYCHDNEHQRQLEASNNLEIPIRRTTEEATHNPFSQLHDLLHTKNRPQKR